MLTLMADWWAWEAVAMMAGWLANYEVALAANAILINIESFTYMVYLGISTTCTRVHHHHHGNAVCVTTILCVFGGITIGISDATNVRVGQLVGAQRPRAARNAAIMGYGMCAFFATLIASLLLIYRYDIPFIFTSDPKVTHTR